jgi:hypothetical protein
MVLPQKKVVKYRNKTIMCKLLLIEIIFLAHLKTPINLAISMVI